jgi:hypothetical protein
MRKTTLEPIFAAGGRIPGSPERENQQIQSRSDPQLSTVSTLFGTQSLLSDTRLIRTRTALCYAERIMTRRTTPSKD